MCICVHVALSRTGSRAHSVMRQGMVWSAYTGQCYCRVHPPFPPLGILCMAWGMMKIMDSSDDGGGCLHRLSFGNEAGEELGLQTLSTGQCAPDAHRLQNIHRTLKPGLSNQFNLHGTHAKRDKEIDAHYEKTLRQTLSPQTSEGPFTFLKCLSSISSGHEKIQYWNKLPWSL